MENIRLNLISGQQCVRDFFLCIRENSAYWPDIDSLFSFDIIQSVNCLSCNSVSDSERRQTFIEIDVPEEDSKMNTSLEFFFNSASLVSSSCQICKKDVQVEVRNQILRIEDTNFITIVLSRGMDAVDGFHLNTKKIICTEEMFVR